MPTSPGARGPACGIRHPATPSVTAGKTLRDMVTQMDPGRDPTLGYVPDLANLGSTGRSLRRRIEQQAPGLHIVLIADDEPFMRALLTATLSPESYVVLEAATGSERSASFERSIPDLVILRRTDAGARRDRGLPSTKGRPNHGGREGHPGDRSGARSS